MNVSWRIEWENRKHLLAIFIIGTENYNIFWKYLHLSMNQHKYSPTAKTMRKQAMKESSYSQQIHQEYNSMADLTLKINRSRQMLIQFNCLCFKLCFTAITMIVYILHLPSLSLSHAHPHTNTLSLPLTHTYNIEHPLTHTLSLSLSL